MENIEVCVRLRPVTSTEKNKGENESWIIQGTKTIFLDPKSNQIYNSKMKSNMSKPPINYFNFNNCFGAESDSDEIYEAIIRKIVLSSFEGINGTIFVYGPTGSGKTYTMMGPSSSTICCNTEKSQSHRKGFTTLNKETPNRLATSQNFCDPNNLAQQSLSKLGVNQRTELICSREVSAKQSSMKLEESLQKHQQRKMTTELSEEKSYHTPRKETPIEALNQSSANEKFINQQIFGNSSGNQHGLITRAIKDIFLQVYTSEQNNFEIHCSYFEIYNDIVFDLLKPVEQLHDHLVIVEDNNKGFLIKDAIKQQVYSLEDTLNKLRKGEANRQYAYTVMNHKSSRSHTIFRIAIKCTKSIDNEIKITESQLDFVDLAGCEKMNVHDQVSNSKRVLDSNSVKKDRIKETQHINKSLFFLTQVIGLLAKGNHGNNDAHIPYRNSCLTKLLKNSLGGTARTAIILCVSPTAPQIEQSMSTQRFGINAKKIENNVKLNIYQEKNYDNLKKMLADYEVKIRQLEIEKLKDKSQNEAYQLAIKRLFEEKYNLMQTKLLNAGDSGFNIKPDINSYGILCNTGQQKRYELSHFKNVGLINKLVQGDDVKISMENMSVGNAVQNDEEKKVVEELRSKSQLMEDRIRVMKEKIEDLNTKELKNSKYLKNYQKKLNCKVFTLRRIKNESKKLNQEKDQIEQFMKNLFSTEPKENNLFGEMDYESANLLGKRLDKVTKKLLLVCEKKKMKHKFKSFVSEIQNNKLLKAESGSINFDDAIQEESSLLQKNDNNELISKLYEKMFNNKFDQTGQFSNEKNIKEMIPDGDLKDILVSDLRNESFTDMLMDFESEEFLYKTKKVFVTEKGIQISQKNDACTETLDIYNEFCEPEKIIDESKVLLRKTDEKINAENLIKSYSDLDEKALNLEEAKSHGCSNLTEECYNMDIESPLRKSDFSLKMNKSDRKTPPKSKKKDVKSYKKSNKNSISLSGVKMKPNEQLNLSPMVLASSRKDSMFINSAIKNELKPGNFVKPNNLNVSCNVINLQIMGPKKENQAISKDDYVSENTLFDDHIFNLKKDDDDCIEDKKSLLHEVNTDILDDGYYLQGSLLNNLNLCSAFEEETVINNLPNFASPVSLGKDSIMISRNNINNSFSFKKDNDDLENLLPNDVSDFKITKENNHDKENTRPYNSEYRFKKNSEVTYMSNLLTNNLNVDTTLNYNVNKRRQR